MSSGIRILIECNRCSHLCRAIHVNSISVSIRKGHGFGLWANYDWRRRWICIRPAAWNSTNSMFRVPMRPIAHRNRAALRADYLAIYWMCSALRTDTVAILDLREFHKRKKKRTEMNFGLFTFAKSWKWKPFAWHALALMSVSVCVCVATTRQKQFYLRSW